VDLLGRQIEARNGLPANETFRVGRRWKPGVYVVHVFEGRSERVIKVVKVR
jgi:hypothetical protein